MIGLSAIGTKTRWVKKRNLAHRISNLYKASICSVMNKQNQISKDSENAQ
tara:strand:+ start:791 stop:940 length:150 start_codon:yes stop_codon:yes gene_type:complete